MSPSARISLKWLIPAVIVSLLPFLYRYATPKMGTVIWGITYMAMTACGLFGVLVVLYLMVLSLWDYLGESLDTTIGTWAFQIRDDANGFMANYKSLSMLIGVVLVLFVGASLPYLSHAVRDVLTRTTNLRTAIHWSNLPAESRHLSNCLSIYH